MEEKLTNESLMKLIEDIVSSQSELKDEPRAIYYCKGLGHSVMTSSLSVMTCDHPECGWCRGMEKALKNELQSYQKTPEMPIINIETETIPNGFLKVNKGSKFTKKKRRNR